MMDNTTSSGDSRFYRYKTITVHPPDDNGAREVWGEYEEVHGGKVFETDGIIGWLYHILDHVESSDIGYSSFVWLNEAGHPTHTFRCYPDGTPSQSSQLTAWLSTLAPIVTWAKEMKT